MVSPDPSVLRRLKELDPRLEVELIECRGGDHRYCKRVDFTGKRACDRWVIYRRIISDGMLNRFGAKFFGKDWQGPIPERLPVCVWQRYVPIEDAKGFYSRDDVVIGSRGRRYVTQYRPLTHEIFRSLRDMWREVDFTKANDQWANDRMLEWIEKEREREEEEVHRLMEEAAEEYKTKVTDLTYLRREGHV